MDGLIVLCVIVYTVGLLEMCAILYTEGTE